MSVKIISLIVFTKCLKVKISLIFAEIFSEQIFLSLIIPKLSPRAALTNANAAFTVCAERETGLTSIVNDKATRWLNLAVSAWKALRSEATITVDEVLG
ncbi:MAG: hypothetical protein PUC38_05590 [Bacteroidales bacterium]|nr:hypothetical protein [Bacteroidales bacterium]